jgi:putative transposase
VAFIIDAFARTIVGCKVSPSMTADFVTEAVEKAVAFRARFGISNLSELIHHHDAGSQYLSLKMVNTLEKHQITESVGTVGDSYDNALAEPINGLYKTELTKTHVWKDWKEVEYETIKYVKWFNKKISRIKGFDHCGLKMESLEQFLKHFINTQIRHTK